MVTSGRPDQVVTSQLQNERRTGLGGSDAPVILGLTPWKTPLELWMQKTGRVEDTPDTPMLRRGRKLEPVVVSEYEEETGRSCSLPSSVLRHPEYPWMIVHIDRFVHEPARAEEPGVLEAKSANLFRIREWKEEPPLPAQVQLQHGMAVAGLSWGSVAGLLGGLEFKYQDFERNDEFIAQLIERLRAFWRLVETDTPPEPEAADTKTLHRLYAQVNGESVDLPAEAVEWDRQRLRAKVEISRLEDLRDEAEAKLKSAIGNALTGILPDGSGVYVWREQTQKAHTVAKSTFRVLRRATG